MAELPYRPNVGILVLNHENRVWIGHRANKKGTEYALSDTFWQMPQGGIDEGEDAELAARRELYEETGISSILPLDATPEWIRYEFPPGVPAKIATKFRGQKQKWFAYRFTGDESEIRINPPPDGHKAEFDQWRWEELTRLPDLVVDFKQDVYRRVVAQFAHLIK